MHSFALSQNKLVRSPGVNDGIHICQPGEIQYNANELNLLLFPRDPGTIYSCLLPKPCAPLRPWFSVFQE
jgi:hypothetical protein